MKKLCLLVCLAVLGAGAANAQVFKGKALDEISTKNPKSEIQVKAIKELDLGGGVVIEKDFILTGKMTDVVSPEKFHKNASFTFIPTEYTDNNGVKHKIKDEIKATYRQKLKPDFKHSEISVGGANSSSSFVFSPSYISDTKKIVKGEGKEVWDDYKNRNTPWGNGEDIEIKANETIYFNFPDVK